MPGAWRNRSPVSRSVPVLLVRLVLVALPLWAVGAVLTHLVFVAFGIPARIELGDGGHRGQAVWIGAQCLVAASAFAASILMTLSDSGFTDPQAARRRTGIAALGLLLVAAGLVWGAHLVGMVDRVLTISLEGALVIGTAVGLGTMWWRADPDRLWERPSPVPPQTAPRAWGSRGR
ncbi:hypothetical protein GCM10009795_028810 [Nocardioides hankookensis]|uniref:DUF2231 domain-containing protein n=1 Tax=Nocardioides hankookensis TaxID=443157 RepID=A0ABW1LEJ6_9ACTN